VKQIQTSTKRLLLDHVLMLEEPQRTEYLDEIMEYRKKERAQAAVKKIKVLAQKPQQNTNTSKVR
jgi:hypothetical protein